DEVVDVCVKEVGQVLELFEYRADLDGQGQPLRQQGGGPVAPPPVGADRADLCAERQQLGEVGRVHRVGDLGGQQRSDVGAEALPRAGRDAVQAFHEPVQARPDPAVGGVALVLGAAVAAVQGADVLLALPQDRVVDLFA